MPHREYLNCRLNSLVIKATQAIEIATQVISQPGFNPVLKDAQSKSQLNLTRTQALFQTILDSMLNQLTKISTCIIQRGPKLSFKLYFIQG